MMPQAPVAATAAQTVRLSPLLLAVFFLSGAPALVYQVAWQRTLGLVLGVDVLATSLVVAVFMLGLGLGALAGGHRADRSRHVLRDYALLELALAICGATSLLVLQWLGTALDLRHFGWTAAACFAALLLPTMLMGATLPLMLRALLAGRSAVGQGFAVVYAINTLGAAAGAWLAGWVLIGLVGLDGSVYLAALTNLGLAAVVLWLGRRQPVQAAAARAGRIDPTVTTAETAAASLTLLLLLAALSGLVALGLQLVWYRLLTVLLHGTSYVFSNLLTVFLLGIAIGGWQARHEIAAAMALRRFAQAQIGIALWVGLSAGLLAHGASWPGPAHLIGASALLTLHPAPEWLAMPLNPVAIYSLLDSYFWAMLLLGPPTLLMGYGFPQLLRAAASRHPRAARTLGRLYLANIIGSVLGALLTGLLLLEYLGSERSLWLLSVLAAAAGGIALHGAAAKATQRPALAAIALALAATFSVQPGALIRALHHAADPRVEFIHFEDRSGVVALRRQDQIIAWSEEQRILGEQRLLINGSANGGFGPDDNAPVLDRRSLLALAAHPQPRSVLLIGLGDGKMLASALSDPRVERVTVVELSASLPQLLRTTPQGRAVLDASRLELVQGDARRWLLAQPQRRFDLVLMWPLHAGLAHSNSLYSAEFMALLAARLEAGGIVYARSVDAQSTARTLALGFEHAWRFDQVGYLLSDAPMQISAARLGAARESLQHRLEVDRETILEQTRGARINRDLRPNAEYYLSYRHRALLHTWGPAPPPLPSSPEHRRLAAIID